MLNAYVRKGQNTTHETHLMMVRPYEVRARVVTCTTPSVHKYSIVLCSSPRRTTYAYVLVRRTTPPPRLSYCLSMNPGSMSMILRCAFAIFRICSILSLDSIAPPFSCATYARQ